MTTQTNETSNVVETSKTNFTAKQKMILAICAMASVVIIVLSSAFATVALLTSSAAVSNVFTIGDVKITMTETKVDEDGVPVEGGGQVDTNTYKLVPNTTYTKDPRINVDPVSEGSFLFVLVRNDIEAIEDTTENGVHTIAAQLAANGWAKYTKAATGWVYVYVGFSEDSEGNSISNVNYETEKSKTVDSEFGYNAAIVMPGEYFLFKTFTIADNAPTNLYGAAKITLTAVAIQTAGFTSDTDAPHDIDEAWEAVKAAYPYINTGTAN